ncbi:hypothetical protein DdX_18288 [Ditylenchus destructor]|uniref:Uncharacterized protein n=1 Tax=Ditylenchus destructor TaxID=166010 RepID=A0AAD4MLU8_9BILA|nr:hypothetical protein DdX_18288 [Ditylenchus destructor]
MLFVLGKSMVSGIEAANAACTVSRTLSSSICTWVRLRLGPSPPGPICTWVHLHLGATAPDPCVGKKKLPKMGYPGYRGSKIPDISLSAALIRLILAPIVFP